MPQDMDVMSTGSTDSSSRPRTRMTRKNALRKVFERVSSFATIWTRNTSPHGRRIFHRDVEQEEFQYASTHCLSSYYSVFVARLAIMVMLAILIGLLTILTWHFTKVYTTKSLNTLAYGLRYELLQRPILRMWNILNSTSEITTSHVKLSEYVIRQYSNPSNQAEQVELYETMKAVTWALFASHKALNAMTINYKNGFVQAFHRDKRSNKTFYIYSDLANYSISASGPYSSSMLSTHQGWDDRSVHGNLSAIWYREPLDPTTGEKIGKAMPILPDDLINIAGLSQVPDGAASWHVAVSKYTQSPLLSAALPVWDDSHENILAVVGVTTALSSVGELMRELVEVHSGHIYLTSQEGYLLATSTNAPLLINSTTGPKLTMAADSQDPVIQMGAQWLQKVYGNKMPENHIVHEENARLGHELYYIDSFFLNLKRLPMVGVIIIPRKYIMGKVDERAFKTLVILISASICILVIGCVCIMILTNGVSKEMKLRAELISHLDARRRAEASSNYKSQFLANMSHELRTPMAAVIGLLDILICDDCLTNEQYAMVTQIRKCSTALLRLLNNILDLSKVESGKLVLEEAEFDLEHELEGLVDMFSVQCINHNVETVLDLSDDIPKLVRGDSARVVQIFANLISNSIKFTSSGHIILRGWCDNSSTFTNVAEFLVEQKREPANIPNLKQHGYYTKKTRKKDNKIILWFEIEDTGCGIDPSKWESVFESFEQADPSTTRLHGGTGLGLCIVRTLINKMGGEIKIVRKDGPGTLMRLFLVLNTPADGTGQHTEVDYSQHGVVVLLALQGRMARLIMSKWLRRAGVFTFEASEWNELTHILQELNQDCNLVHNNVFDVQKSSKGNLKEDIQKVQDKRDPAFIFVIDIGLLNLRTDIWKEQLNFLDRFQEKAKFAWMLNHDTSNAIKTELRSRGHILMVNKPLYKAKMVQILEAYMKSNELQKKNSYCSMNTIKEENSHEFVEIDAAHYDNTSSDDSDKFEVGTFSNSMIASDDRTSIPKSCSLKQRTINNCLVELTPIHLRDNDSRIDGSYLVKHNRNSVEDAEHKSACAENFVCDGRREQANSPTGREVNGAKSLEGLRILLAEDNPLLQKVATTMLEKMGATVIAVGDGKQAVDALNYSHSSEEYTRKSLWQNEVTRPQTETSSPYSLILMDCQMPKMDGYEATKAIRNSEVGTGLHIPIVALTAHAMSSDEAKCLQVGMDAYLTKPIDFKLMVSTILSLATRTALSNA